MYLARKKALERGLAFLRGSVARARIFGEGSYV